METTFSLLSQRLSVCHLSLSLAANHDRINDAVVGRLDLPFLSPDLENKLLHFSHGRRLPRDTPFPEAHRNKKSSDYVGEFRSLETPDVANFYSELCEYVHPAAASVTLFIQSESAEEHYLSSKPNSLFIADFLKRLPEVMAPVAMLAFNAPLVTLGVLNRLQAPSLYVREVTPELCSGVTGWKKIEEAWHREA